MLFAILAAALILGGTDTDEVHHLERNPVGGPVLIFKDSGSVDDFYWADYWLDVPEGEYRIRIDCGREYKSFVYQFKGPDYKVISVMAGRRHNSFACTIDSWKRLKK